MHRRNFDKQFFRQGKSIYLFEWTICVKQNRWYNFFETLYKHLSSGFPTRAKTQNFWSKK